MFLWIHSIPSNLCSMWFELKCGCDYCFAHIITKKNKTKIRKRRTRTHTVRSNKPKPFILWCALRHSVSPTRVCIGFQIIPNTMIVVRWIITVIDFCVPQLQSLTHIQNLCDTRAAHTYALPSMPHITKYHPVNCLTCIWSDGDCLVAFQQRTIQSPTGQKHGINIIPSR